MSITYNITTNFGAKDELPANDPDKIVFGSEFTQEFTAIKSAFNLAAPSASPTFTGTATFANAAVNGTLTANLTGDVTGTLLTAAQPNITSVGTLTSASISGDLAVNTDTLFVDVSANRVGIGTDTPASILELEDATSCDLRLRATALRVGKISVANGYMGFSFDSSGGNTERMRINDSGNVGIGTTNPGANLEISSSASTKVRISDSDNVNQRFDISHNAGFTAITAGNNAANGQMAFYQFDGTTTTEAFRLDANGNLCVGIAAGAEKLHVNGDAVFGDANTNGNVLIRKRFDGTASLKFQRTTAGSPIDASVFCDQFENLNLSWNESADISNQALFFKSNNSEVMRIEASGKVGIGVSSGLGGVLTLPHQESLSFHDAAGSARKVLEFDTGELKHGSAGAGLSTQTFFTGGTERLRIDGNGNVGIGISSPATALQVSGVVTASGATPSFNLSDSDGGAHRFASANTSLSIEADTGDAGGSMNFLVGTLERMRIGPTGNVGIGDTSPSRKLSVRDVSATPFISIVGSTSSVPGLLFGDADSDAVGQIRYDNTNNSMTFTTANTVKMLIQSDGNMLIGKTVKQTQTQGLDVQQLSASDTDGALGLKSGTNSTTGNVFINCFLQNGVGSGRIQANGPQALAFAAFSDRNLKENIEDLSPQLGNIMQLRPVEFDYKDGSGHQIGFIAQEVEEVWPDLVSGEEGSKSVVGLGKTESRLIKALQEAVGRIEALEAEVAALKAGV